MIILKIAFVNLIKKRNINFFENIKYYFGNKLNKIARQNENFFVYNFNEKTKRKLVRKLSKYDYAIVENDVDIGFKSLEGQTFTKYMIYETYQNCKRNRDEITLCINTYSEENVKIIKDLARRIKVVNIVTENKVFFNLDRTLEQQNIYITVSNNKRKSLKNAEVMVNFDFKSLKTYNFNRNMTIIDLTNNMIIPRAFTGKVIRKLNVMTKKKLRIFLEHENFNKSKLIEYQILNINDYLKIREYIKLNKIQIANN